MSKEKTAKKIQRKAARRAERKLPVANEAPEAPPEQETGFDPVKDSPGGE